MNRKIAFTGTSGSGKTTLVKFVSEKFSIPHISGSAWDLKNDEDKHTLRDQFGFPGGGHAGVIKYSALNPEYGVFNQQLLLKRRLELGMLNQSFVTDRSPIDNLTYFIMQCGYHPMVTDHIVSEFMNNAFKAYQLFTHIIYVKAVQPTEVENNQSRIANRFYQKAVDSMFEYWLYNFFRRSSQVATPKLLVIDYWNLEARKQEVTQFLSHDYPSK